MYALGIPISQYRRTTQVLGHEGTEPIYYEDEQQDADFYLFKFPNIDEYEFREIVLLLKGNGIVTIGADTQLTERKIMKLVDILNEQESPQDNMNIDEAQGIIARLKTILEVWQTKKYNNDQERWEMYYLDIQELVEDYEEEMSMKGITMDAPMNEGIKKLVKREIRKLLQ
jgi:hypothetical protein